MAVKLPSFPFNKRVYVYVMAGQSSLHEIPAPLLGYLEDKVLEILQEEKNLLQRVGGRPQVHYAITRKFLYV